MVERILQFINRETGGLHEAAFLLAVFAFLSKLLALLRDRALAHFFGAGAQLDIYYAAFRVPDFLYVALASLFASAVVIPFLAEKLDRPAEARRFFAALFTSFFAAMALVSIVVGVAMPLLGSAVAPGLSEAARAEMVFLSRIMLLSPFLLGLSGLFASVTQSLRRFFVYALSPVLYNIGIIAGVLFLYPAFGLAGLAYGVIVGAALHLLIQVPVILKHGFVPRFTLDIPWGDIRRVFALSLPRTATLAAHHLMLLALIALASFMAQGSIAIFNLSFNLQSVPLSIIGISYSTAAFPTLARLFSNGDRMAFVRHITAAARHVIFWSMPVLALFVVLRAQIVRSILGSGQFDWDDTRLVAAALALFVVSIVAQALMLLFVRGYYAAGKTRAPLVINVLSLGAVIALAFALIEAYESAPVFRHFIESLLRVDGISGTKILMLPLAFSIGTLANIAVLWWAFQREFHLDGTRLARTLRQSVVSAVIVGFMAHSALRVLDDVFDINTFVGIFFQGLLAGIAGIIAGIVVLRLIGNEELAEATRSLHRRFWERRPIAPDQTDL